MSNTQKIAFRVLYFEFTNRQRHGTCSAFKVCFVLCNFTNKLDGKRIKLNTKVGNCLNIGSFKDDSLRKIVQRNKLIGKISLPSFFANLISNFKLSIV